MPMHDDATDASFVENMQALLGYDDDKVDTILSLLAPDELIELADAVVHLDRERAETIIRSAAVDEDDEDARSLIDPLSDPTKAAPHQDDKDALGEDEHATRFRIGQQVKFAGHDATVSKPHGPGGTIGIMVKGKLKMVQSKEITPIKEAKSPLMLSLARLRRLAGINESETPWGQDEEQDTSSEHSDEQDSGDQGDGEATESDDTQSGTDVTYAEVGEDETCEEEKCPVACANEALDQLEQSLPQITLADLKGLRQRLYSLTASLNESVQMRTLGRAAKRG